MMRKRETDAGTHFSFCFFEFTWVISSLFITSLNFSSMASKMRENKRYASQRDTADPEEISPFP